MKADIDHRSAVGGRSWWWWLAAGMALSALLLLAAQTLRLRPQTYQEAVAVVLEGRDIAYRTIVVGELRTPTSGNCFLHDCRKSAAPVTVVQERPVRGRIVCRDGDANCSLTLPALRLYNEPLPDLAGARRFPRTFEEMVLVGRAWARSVCMAGYRESAGR
jgi:hypothetical protein